MDNGNNSNGSTNPENNVAWFKYRKDSPLGMLLDRLAINPLIRIEEVSDLWPQAARGGGVTKLTPTRASFVVDALAQATEGKPVADRPRKGLACLSKMKDSVITTAPAVASPAAPTLGPGLDEEPKVDFVVSKPVAMVAAQTAISTHTATETTDDGEEIEITFPSTPFVPEKMKGYIRSATYGRMDACLAAGKHIAIAGPPGVGKSTDAEQWCAENKRPMVTINADGGLRRRDIEGAVELVDKNGVTTTKFVCAEYAAAAINGWVVIINEVNAADPDALLYMNGQMAVPFRVNVHGRSYPVHKDFRLIVTYNPGLLGTKNLPPAFKDRFVPFKVAFPKKTLLRKLLELQGMPSNATYADSLMNFAYAVVEANTSGPGLKYQLSPRRLYDAVFFIEKANMGLKAALQAAVIDAVDTNLEVETLTMILNNTVN